MQTFKPSEAELIKLREAASLLKRSNEALSVASKGVAAAKKAITEWLDTERGIKLEALKIGDTINIEGASMIEIGSLTKFDDKGFLLAEPALYQQWTKTHPVKKFKALVALALLLATAGTATHAADLGVHVQIDLYDAHLAPQNTTRIYIYPEWVPAGNPVGMTTSDRIQQRISVVTGDPLPSVTVSNLIWGDFRLEAMGIFTTTTNWFRIDSTTTPGTVLNITNIMRDAFLGPGSTVPAYSPWNFRPGTNATFRKTGPITYVEGPGAYDSFLVTNANGDRVLLNTNGTITASRSISTKRLDLYTTNYVNDGFPTIGMHYQQPDTTPIELDFSVNPSGFVFNNPVQAAGFFGSGAHLTGLDAGAIATGTVDPARLPANVVTNHQAQLTLGNGYGFPTPLPELEFTNATHTAAIAYAADTGLTFANDSPGTGFGTGFWFSHAQLGADDASGLQNLNASQLTSGTVDSARLPPFDPAGAAHDATNGWPWMALEAGGITQDAADLRYDRLNAAHDATNTWPWLVLSDAAGAAATAAQAATNGWPWLAGYAPTTGAVAFVTTAMLTNKIPWTNVLSLTNSQSQTVDMNLREADFETNQGFTFLGLINKSSTNYQSIVVTVRNNGTTNIPISAPPNTTTNGTLPYVATNSGISKVLIEYHPRYNYTNMLVFPLK